MGDRSDVPKGDHAGLARKLVSRFYSDGQPPVFCEGAWWQYTGAYWRKLDDNELRRDMVNVGSWAQWSDGEIKCTSSLIASVLSLAESLSFAPGFFDQAQRGLAFKDKFATVRATGSVVCDELSPDNRVRWAVPENYDPEARCPRWHQFLSEVWEGHADKEERKQFLGEFIGACLTGTAWIGQRAVILSGEGSNGKSVLCDAIRSLFPRECVVSVPPQDLRTPERVARLAGANINIVADIPQRGLTDTGLIKQVISGDQVDARRLYQSSFSFRPVAGNLFSANQIPDVDDYSHGFQRRWVILTFDRKFTGSRRSDELVDSLVSERAGVVSWALRCAANMMRDGYTIPKSSDKAVLGWRLMTDQVAAFVDEECVILDGGDYGDFSKTLYNRYKSWAEENGHKRPMTHKKFSERLGKLNIRYRRMPGGRQWAINWFGQQLPGASNVKLEDGQGEHSGPESET